MTQVRGDYYKILEVPRSASRDEILMAFRKKAKETHPDLGITPEDKQARNEAFKPLNEAFEVLGDNSKRQNYDQLLETLEKERSSREGQKSPRREFNETPAQERPQTLDPEFEEYYKQRLPELGNLLGLFGEDSIRILLRQEYEGRKRQKEQMAQRQREQKEKQTEILTKKVILPENDALLVRAMIKLKTDKSFDGATLCIKDEAGRLIYEISLIPESQKIKGIIGGPEFAIKRRILDWVDPEKYPYIRIRSKYSFTEPSVISTRDGMFTPYEIDNDIVKDNTLFDCIPTGFSRYVPNLERMAHLTIRVGKNDFPENNGKLFEGIENGIKNYVYYNGQKCGRTTGVSIEELSRKKVEETRIEISMETPTEGKPPVA